MKTEHLVNERPHAPRRRPPGGGGTRPLTASGSARRGWRVIRPAAGSPPGFPVALCGAGQELPAAAALRSPWCDLRGLVTGRLAATSRRSPPRGFLAGAEGGENDVDCLVAMPGLQGLSAYH